MSHSKSIAQILGRTFHAVTGKSLYACDEAADIFEILLRYHGLALVSTCGFVVEWDDEGDPVSLVELDDDGIWFPKLKEPLSPDLAHAFGEALIAVAHQARKA